MCFIPGAYFALGLGILCKILFGRYPTEFANISGDLSESLLFIIVAYISGHIIQTLANGFKIRKWKWNIDQGLKKSYWGGYYPSQNILFASSPLLEDHTKEMVLASLMKMGILDRHGYELFSKNPTKESRKMSQSLFNILLHNHDDNEASGVKTAESYFYMFRGFFFSSQLFFLFGLMLLGYQWFANSLETNLIIFTCMHFLLWRLFRYRCRGAAEGFVKKTFVSSVVKTTN